MYGGKRRHATGTRDKDDIDTDVEVQKWGGGTDVWYTVVADWARYRARIIVKSRRER